MTERKLQTPNSKLQRSSKHQAPKTAAPEIGARGRRTTPGSLELGIRDLRSLWKGRTLRAPCREETGTVPASLGFNAWSFSGGWWLKFGVWV